MGEIKQGVAGQGRSRVDNQSLSVQRNFHRHGTWVGTAHRMPTAGSESKFSKDYSGPVATVSTPCGAAASTPIAAAAAADAGAAGPAALYYNYLLVSESTQ